jgi:RimJ/RimL family protein N-acetyltransferase
VIQIRRATEPDIPMLVEMGLRFQGQSEYAEHLRATEATLTTVVGHLLSNPNAVIWLAENADRVIGMIAASLYTQPMSGECIGSEICWWMEPEARGGRTAIKLLRTAEAWAQSHGAVIFQMMAPNAAVGALYERLDYRPIETHYQRRLS